MFKNKLGEYSPIPKLMHLNIPRRESLTTLEEGEFKVPIDSCIKTAFIRNEFWCPGIQS